MNLRTIREHSFWYWLFALTAIIAGMALSHYFQEKRIWIEGQYRAYQLLDWVTPNPREPKHTVLVLIGDGEYWTGPLARRVPIHRDYLASVVKALDRCEPSVIALDFDLRSPTPDGSLVEHSEYSKETALLVDTVLEISKRRPLVLPAMIEPRPPGEPSPLQSSVYGELPFEKGKLQRGFINLPYDVRRIPTPQPITTGGSLDSFAVSIVRARHENVLEITEGSEALPFGTFIRKPFPTVPVKDLLSGDCSLIPSKIAIVGAGWSRSTFGKGGQVDVHPSPLGPMTGAVIHANYVEALIDSTARKPLPESIGQIIELLVLIAFAILLAIKTHQAYHKVLLVFASGFALVFFSYIAWQNLGYYFDFFLPVVFLLLHAFTDYFKDIQQEARAFRKSTH